MEVSRLGVKLELQLPATATAAWDPSHICNLHHSSWQHGILNPMNKARDRTCILMDTNQVLNLLSHKELLYHHFLNHIHTFWIRNAMGQGSAICALTSPAGDSDRNEVTESLFETDAHRHFCSFLPLSLPSMVSSNLSTVLFTLSRNTKSSFLALFPIIWKFSLLLYSCSFSF